MRSLVLLSLVGLGACASDYEPHASEPADSGFGVGAVSSVPEPPQGKGGSPSFDPSEGSAGDFFGGGGEGFGRLPFADPVIVADPPPPPISGGTLLVSPNNRWAVVSDPDRDQVVVVDLDAAKVTATIALEPGDEPGRLAEDGAGHVHVALRRGGALLTIDPAAGTLLERRPVCAYPRGLAYDAAGDVLHVACAEGLLVSLPAVGGEATRSVSLDRDLRDVVVESGRLWVSRFRSAEVLLLDDQGALSERFRPLELRGLEGFGGASGEERVGTPGVAWRMVADPAGGVFVLHQRAELDAAVVDEGGYSTGCTGIVAGAISHYAPGEPILTSTMPFVAPLNVDLAVQDDDFMIASAGAMTSGELNMFFPTVPRFTRADIELSDDPTSNGCTGFSSELGELTVDGQAVAVGFDGPERVIQLREPSMLIIGDRAVNLPGDSRQDTGHLLFHAATGAGLACASCHPEGREDGNTWVFADIGARRTQSIGGMLAGTAPFHWSGDEATFGDLVSDVMTGRMLGPLLTDAHSAALKNWIDAIPRWQAPPAEDSAAVDRGRVLFETQSVGCSTCHAGEKLTNNRTYDVGTGANLQVPSLRGLVWRAPFLHDGCAKSLADRFGDCGGDAHGDVSALTSAERSDLIAYLKSL